MRFSPDKCLIGKTCTPCQEGEGALKKEEVNIFLKELDSDWGLNEKGHLYKEYKFANFLDALSFVNRIGEIAEKEGHHPDITLSWGLCKVEIWTHKVGVLTENDFILAAKIEHINEDRP